MTQRHGNGSVARKRVALVTGGTKGIGLATAIALHDAGHCVVAASRSAGGVQDLEDYPEASMRQLQVDVTDDGSVEKLFAQISDAWGGVDILVNNAASFDAGSAMALPPNSWLSHFDVKVAGYGRCIRAAVPGMRSSGWGRVINVAGIAARIASETTAGMINAGVANLTKMVSASETGSGITVNTVHPGPTSTNRHRLLTEARAADHGTDRATEEQRLLQSLPQGRLVQPEEVATLIAFLASEDARSITGQAIAVDGGLAASVQY